LAEDYYVLVLITFDMEDSEKAEIRTWFKHLLIDVLVALLLIIWISNTSIYYRFVGLVFIVISVIVVGYGSYLIFKLAVWLKNWSPDSWTDIREILPPKPMEYATYGYIILGGIMISSINPDRGGTISLGGFNLFYVVILVPLIPIVWVLNNEIFPKYFNSYWKCFEIEPEKARPRLKDLTGLDFKKDLPFLKKVKFLIAPLKLAGRHVSIRFRRTKEGTNIAVLFRADEKEKAKKLMKMIDEILEKNED